MSTRCYIAKQIGDDQYRSIYCHSDGYLTYNGALLLDHYNSPEKVDELLDLGDLSLLGEKPNPDPAQPHSFEYSKRQEGVTVAYGRDRGDENTRAKVRTLAQLDAPGNWTDYVYLYTQDNEWKYFRAGHSQDGLRDVKEDLDAAYAAYNLSRPVGYYGGLSAGIAEELRREQEAAPESDPLTMKME